MDHPRIAIVLSGGGARGAYEAGVVRWIGTRLGPRLGRRPPIQIICGTSVGAINGAWYAGCGFGEASVREMSRFWKELEPAQVMSFRATRLLTSPFYLFRRQLPMDRQPALLDNQKLQRVIRQRFPHEGLRARLASGRLEAFCVTTCEIATGRTVYFVDRHQPGSDGFLPYPGSVVRRTRIGPQHVLASAAIPFVFPPVEVEGRFHVDGSLRQNTPLTPALRMGADKVLVLGVKRALSVRSESALAAARESRPNMTYLAGKALDALMLDPVEADLHRVEQYNALFAWGERTYGAAFMDTLNADLGHRRGTPYCRVETLLVRPREDLGRVAAEVFARMDAHGPTGRLLKVIAAREDGPSSDADLLSFLLFDRAYTAAIERLGFEDAAQQKDELTAFFTEGQPG